MDSPVSSAAPLNRSYVSTGHLPDPELVQALVNEAYERFRSRSEGHNSEVYPALAKVYPDSLRRRKIACVTMAGGFCSMHDSGRVSFARGSS